MECWSDMVDKGTLPLCHLHKLEKYVRGRRSGCHSTVSIRRFVCRLPFFHHGRTRYGSRSAVRTGLRDAALSEAVASREPMSCASFANMSGLSQVSFADTADPRLPVQWALLAPLALFILYIRTPFHLCHLLATPKKTPREATTGTMLTASCLLLPVTQ
jgi:hypothetical protein